MGVGEAPCRNADAARDLLACRHDGRVVGGLLVEVGVAGRGGHVQLRVRNIDTEGGEGLQIAYECGGGADLARRHMALQTHPVNRSTVRLDHLDEILGPGRFTPCLITVVIVVVELSRRVGISGGSEGNGDKRRTDSSPPHGIGGPVGSVFIECLIDNIPSVAFALVKVTILRTILTKLGRGIHRCYSLVDQRAYLEVGDHILNVVFHN